MTKIFRFCLRKEDRVNAKRFEFLAAFYRHHGISLVLHDECSMDCISFCFRQHNPQNPLHLFYTPSSSSSQSLDAYQSEYLDYLHEISQQKLEESILNVQTLADTALLFDLFLRKPVRWNSPLKFDSLNLSPGLYCQYTLARIQGIIEETSKNSSASSSSSQNHHSQLFNNGHADANEQAQFEACESQITLMIQLRDESLTYPLAFPRLFNQIVHLCHICSRLLGTFRVKGSAFATKRLACYQNVHFHVSQVLLSFGIPQLSSRM